MDAAVFGSQRIEVQMPFQISMSHSIMLLRTSCFLTSHSNSQSCWKSILSLKGLEQRNGGQLAPYDPQALLFQEALACRESFNRVLGLDASWKNGADTGPYIVAHKTSRNLMNLLKLLACVNLQKEILSY